MWSRAQLALTWTLGQAFGRRIVMMGLALSVAGVPLLPTNEMKVAGTLLAGLVLGIGIYVSLRSGAAVGRTVLDPPVIAFLAVAVLATVFAVNRRVSLVPDATRGEGLFDYFIYLPTALAAARLCRVEVREILAVLAGAGALIGAIAVAQYYGLDVTPWMGSYRFAYGRSWGTLSNPDFLGGYTTAVLPISVAMAAGAAEDRQWLGYAGASTLLYAALLGSETRSAWFATAPAALILLGCLPRSAQTYRRLATLVLAFAAVTAVMTVTRPQVSFGNRAVSALSPADSSLRGRLWIWKQSVVMIRERPVLGWGFSAVLGHLPGIGTPEYFEVFGRGRLYIDAAHNDLLQVAINMGLAGLAAYLWIWATAARAVAGAARGPAPPGSPEAAAILAGLAAYFVWLQFLWSHIGDTNVFWVLAGLAVSLGRAAAGGDRAAAGADGAGPALNAPIQEPAAPMSGTPSPLPPVESPGVS